MRLRIYSDIHLEAAEFLPPKLSADVVVLAGDIGEGETGLRWARTHFDGPIVYVAGNHEFYGHRLPNVVEQLRESASRFEIHFLENNAIVVHDVRFIGATLWTDFCVNAHARKARPTSDAARIAMWDAKRLLNDYRYIRVGTKRRKQRDRLQPEHTLSMHAQSVHWLRNEIGRTISANTVVVTHHAPHLNSVPSERIGAPYVPCYASHLPDLVCSPVDLWIHGHIHASVDYTVRGTRVLSNPRGRGNGANPNFLFNGLIVDL